MIKVTNISILVFAVVFLVFGLSEARSQVLKFTEPFSTSTPFLETDKRVECIKIGKEFIVISKTKGNLTGDSQWALERYGEDLKTVFSTALTVSVQEDYKQLYYNGQDIVLFSINHNTSDKVSRLLAYGFDPGTGAQKWEKVLQELKIGDWVSSPSKGRVKENFENSISSCLKSNFVPALQYQYDLVFSPDSSLIMSYIYDYGQRTTMANLIIFDTKLNLVHEETVPIDNGFTNYGLSLNNKGQVYILNADRIGRIVLVKYDIPTKDAQLLDIQNASTSRENLTMKVWKDDIVYVANINTRSGQFSGIMYSKFNFELNLVEKINYHEVSMGLKQTINALRQSNKNVRGDESWKGYQITNFIINEYEKIIIVLEKREILSLEFAYDPSASNDPERWREKQGKVNAEGILMFSFNMDDDVLWENFYLKSQVADVSAGITSSSFNFDNSAEGKLRIVYGTSDNGSANFNLINYVEWDEYNGNKVKDITLENGEKMTLLRNYVVWWDKKFVVAGKKGMLGKKSFLSLYQY
ncbi:MAG: hypothetical protein ACK4ND_05640 [Cytophagaceae bacterium]